MHVELNYFVFCIYIISYGQLQGQTSSCCEELQLNSKQQIIQKKLQKQDLGLQCRSLEFKFVIFEDKL